MPIEFVTPIPYAALQHMLDDTAPWGIRAYDKAINLDELSDEVIDVILDWIPRKQCPLSFMPIFPLRGRCREVPDDATAFGSSRSSRWAMSIVGQGLDDETFAADRAWARDFYEALRPFAPSAAVYLNFEAEASEDRMKACYGDEKYRRLAALKTVWDPDNVRHNPNIKPAPAGDDFPRPRQSSETPTTPVAG